MHVQPSLRTFRNAYKVLHLPFLSFKTRETAFQVLNRTVWTNNKTFKSKMRLDPDCVDVGKWKQWNIFYMSVLTTLS
jgi:hypothetical protein